MSHASSGSAPPDTGHMRRAYVRVVVSWLAVLLGLFVFQEYFS